MLTQGVRECGFVSTTYTGERAAELAQTKKYDTDEASTGETPTSRALRHLHNLH